MWRTINAEREGLVEPLKTVAERVKAFLAAYGERGELVLRAALERAWELEASGARVLGDFDNRGLKRKLEERGLKYNPGQLLRRLERDYMLIETSYRSSTQRWWRFVDKSEIERALGWKPSEVDVEGKLVRAQFASIQPARLVKDLEEISSKVALSRDDVERLRRLLFNELELAVKLTKKMRELGGFEEELTILGRLMELAFRAAKRLEQNL
ncbi:MAG: hypothetical protein QXU97_01095 [Fervidicoccaceae archaeon]